MHIVTYQGKTIASFANKEDAEQFYEWKCERLLFEQNESILDQIAQENDLDRKYPGLFPTSVTERYYDGARKQISRDCKLLEAAEPGVRRSAEKKPRSPKL